MLVLIFAIANENFMHDWKLQNYCGIITDSLAHCCLSLNASSEIKGENRGEMTKNTFLCFRGLATPSSGPIEFADCRDHEKLNKI